MNHRARERSMFLASRNCLILVARSLHNVGEIPDWGMLSDAALAYSLVLLSQALVGRHSGVCCYCSHVRRFVRGLPTRSDKHVRLQLQPGVRWFQVG